LPDGSRVIETGGYKGRSRELSKDALHEGLSWSLGVPRQRIAREYGMCELSSQAYDTPSGPERSFHFPPWARVQVVSPETGEEVASGQVGILRVCDLANVASAVLVQTEDLARRTEHGFEWCGRAALAPRRGCSLMTA
jgi:hypothetical protein